MNRNQNTNSGVKEQVKHVQKLLNLFTEKNNFKVLKLHANGMMFLEKTWNMPEFYSFLKLFLLFYSLLK